MYFWEFHKWAPAFERYESAELNTINLQANVVRQKNYL